MTTKKKKEEKILFSKILGDFLMTYNRARNSLPSIRDIVKTCEAKSVDFYHILELDKYNYEDRAKLCTKQVANLKERRKAKDEIDLYAPLVDLFDTPEGRKVYNQLEQILGLARKQEERQAGKRYYKQRVPDSFGVNSIGEKAKIKQAS